MNTETLQKMRSMKLYGMHRAFSTALESGLDDYTLDQFVSMMVESEADDRQDRRVKRTITNARFRYKACIEHIVYEARRELDKNQVLRLAEGTYLRKGENVIITGSTGAGKSYLASALGYQACEEGSKTLYFNTIKLMTKLKMAKADGSYIKEMMRIERADLLILDDFGLEHFDSQTRLILLEMVEDRYSSKSIIIASQLPIEVWSEIIGDKTISDAVLDRLVHNAHKIELKGESMRRKRQ
jgi:DNA replication protein DnaC